MATITLLEYLLRDAQLGSGGYKGSSSFVVGDVVRKGTGLNHRRWPVWAEAA